MARKRIVDPELCRTPAFAELSPSAQVLFLLLRCFCDDYGNIPYNTTAIKMAVFPGGDQTKQQIEELLRECIASKLIRPYEVDSKQFLHYNGWDHKTSPNYQKLDRPTKKWPDPPKVTQAKLFGPEGGGLSSQNQPQSTVTTTTEVTADHAHSDHQEFPLASAVEVLKSESAQELAVETMFQNLKEYYAKNPNDLVALKRMVKWDWGDDLLWQSIRKVLCHFGDKAYVMQNNAIGIQESRSKLKQYLTYDNYRPSIKANKSEPQPKKQRDYSKPIGHSIQPS